MAEYMDVKQGGDNGTLGGMQITYICATQMKISLNFAVTVMVVTYGNCIGFNYVETRYKNKLSIKSGLSIKSVKKFLSTIMLDCLPDCDFLSLIWTISSIQKEKGNVLSNDTSVWRY